VAAPAFEDLTARARIRQAALAHFAEHGFERATIRGIAAAAGVSPGLLRHHFGSKQALREAVDAHVIQEVRRISDEMMVDGARGDLGPAVFSREGIRPFQDYLMRALMDGSPSISTIFDEMIEPTEQWLEFADKDRTDPPFADRRTRATVVAAMKLGVFVLREHVSRVLGVDILTREGEQRIALALLDIYSHVLVSPELAATARAAFDGPSSHKETPQ
jgi:AcrR family transcriptional regulator